MSKRFTDSEKWKKKWFRSLSPLNKIFWIYLCDNCDHAGVWEVDFDFAEILIGGELSKKDIIQVFNKQIEILQDSKKWFIKDFVEFQYGVLNPENRAHNSVLNVLKKEGAYKELIRSLQGLPKGAIDKDKDKDKDNKKGFLGEEKKEDIYYSFDHLSITNTEHKKLIARGYSEDAIIKIYQKIQNCSKNKKYKSLYLTAADWLEREIKSPLLPQVQEETWTTEIPGGL